MKRVPLLVLLLTPPRSFAAAPTVSCAVWRTHVVAFEQQPSGQVRSSQNVAPAQTPNSVRARAPTEPVSR